MRSLILFIAGITLAGCAAEADDVVIEEIDGVTYVRNGAQVDTTNFPYRFVLEQTFGVEQEPVEELLATVSYIQVGSDGTVYVLDSRNHRIAAFAPDGSLIWSAGRSGEGPGEFTRPMGMALLADSVLYVSNHTNRAVAIWKTSGEFLQSRSLPTNARYGSIAGLIVPNFLVFAGSESAVVGASIRIVDANHWLLVDSLEVRQTRVPPVPVGLAITAGVHVDGVQLHIGSAIDEWSFKSFDFEGENVRDVSRESNHRMGYGIVADEITRDLRFEDLGGVMWITTLPGGHLLTYSQWTDVDDPDQYVQMKIDGTAPELNWFSSLDAFDEEGRYLASQEVESKVPVIGWPRMIGPDGKLYTSTTTPYPQIRRYRIETR